MTIPGDFPDVTGAKWTRESVLESVRSFAVERGYQPVSNESSSYYGLPSFGTVVRLFGSWNAMIKEAGFEPYPARSSAQAKRRAFLDRQRPVL